jgi:hypothetical protein
VGNLIITRSKICARLWELYFELSNLKRELKPFKIDKFREDRDPIWQILEKLNQEYHQLKEVKNSLDSLIQNALFLPLLEHEKKLIESNYQPQKSRSQTQELIQNIKCQILAYEEEFLKLNQRESKKEN